MHLSKKKAKTRVKDTYFDQTRTAFYGIICTVPLLLFYEFLLFVLHNDHLTRFRSSADIWLKAPIHWFGPYGMAAVGLVVFGILTVILFSRNTKDTRLRADYLILIFLESLMYALLFGIIATNISPLFAASIESGDLLIVQVMLSLGAGVYEELIFRVVAFGLLGLFLSRVLSIPALLSYPVAAVLSSYAFSILHGVAPFELRNYLLIYRFIIGLLLCVLYFFRGLGVAVWTHTLYDFLVIIVNRIDS